MLAKLNFLTIIWAFFVLAQSINIFGQQEINSDDTAAPKTTQIACAGEAANKYKYIVSDGIKNFINNLNEQARCGYKLKTLTKIPFGSEQKFDAMIIAAILELDAGERYEYDWFESFTPGEAQTRMNLRAEKGFYFRDVLPFAQNLCSNTSEYSLDKTDGEKILDTVLAFYTWSLGNVYFLERQAGKSRQYEYRVEIGVPGKGNGPAADLQRHLDAAVQRNFYPVTMVTYKDFGLQGVALLLEKNKENLPPNPAPQYQTLYTEFNFEKKVNRFAKEGYRLFYAGKLVAFRHGLLVKADGDPKQYSYSNINGDDKLLLKKLNGLAKKNFSLRFVREKSQLCDVAEGVLIFERQTVARQENVNFQILNLFDRQTSVDLAADAAKESEQFKKLVSDGYIPREMFYGRKSITILFERRN